VALAAAGLAQQQQRVALGDKPQGRQVIDELGVDRGLEVEVELGQGAADREVGKAQPRGHPAVAGGGRLLGHQLGEEGGVAQLLVTGPVQQAGQRLGGADQLEVAEVVFKLLVQPAGGLGCHGRSPQSRS
jgi:hypothetical protein